MEYCNSKLIKIMYTEKMLAAVVARENNNKRKYLVVNPLQGKHVPVKPSETMKMFSLLADIVREKYAGEKLLIIGFAETATAIGTALAAELGSYYMQTTRENVPEAEYLFFTESHSHAAEQRLVSSGLAEIIKKVNRIIFAEDEITTGNTMLKIVNIIRKKYGANTAISAVSVLNGMDSESLERFRLNNIDVHWLVKTDHSGYTEIAEKYHADGEYVSPNINTPAVKAEILNLGGWINTRKCTQSREYIQACDRLFESICEKTGISAEESVLVMGTEEFMFPAIYTAKRLEDMGCCVNTHSTTRSPIVVSMAEEYLLHKRYELVSMYEESRTTYIYDTGKYDRILIITDSQNIVENGVNSLVNALYSAGNENIRIIRWTDDEIVRNYPHNQGEK